MERCRILELFDIIEHQRQAMWIKETQEEALFNDPKVPVRLGLLDSESRRQLGSR